MPTQSDLRFTFAIGEEPFEVVEFSLQEGLSEPFVLQAELASANPAIDFGAVLDRAALLTIWHGDMPVRYVHGAVSSFVQGETGFRRTRYSAVVEPRLARLALSSDWRIFQALTQYPSVSMFAAPTMLTRLINHPLAGSTDTRNLRTMIKVRDAAAGLAGGG